jgi:hypothetical protein
MIQKRQFTLSATLLAVFLSPQIYAIEDCGTSVTECKMWQTINTQQKLIENLTEQLKKLTDKIHVSSDDKLGIGTTNPKAKLDVNGSIRGNNLHFLRCGGVNYNCNPRMCLDLCIKKGLRMATYDEVYAWASTGKDHCAYMWMLHSQHPKKVFRGFPMYNNRTLDGCGGMNTGNIPRMSGVGVFDWDSTIKYDCACAGIK